MPIIHEKKPGEQESPVALIPLFAGTGILLGTAVDLIGRIVTRNIPQFEAYPAFVALSTILVSIGLVVATLEHRAYKP